MDKYIYIIAIQGSHGAELTSSTCGYYNYSKAEEVLKKDYHEKGMKYMKIFTIQMMDVETSR